MGRRNKVGVLFRAKEGFLKPVWEGNKLKPLVGILGGAEIHRPEGMYYLRYTENGKAKMENVGRNPADVLTFVARRQALVELETKAKSAGLKLVNPEEPLAEAPGRPTIRAAMDAYLNHLERKKKHQPTIDSKRSQLRRFADWCKHRFLEELTTYDMIEFRDFLLAQPLDPCTVHNNLLTIVTFLKHNPLLSVTKLLDKDDWPEKPETTAEKYSEEEIALLRKHADEKTRLILDLFLATGCREQEIAHLEFDDLDPKTHEVKIRAKYGWEPKTKAGTRDIPIAEELMTALLKTRGDNKLIFPSPTGAVEQHFLDRVFKPLGKRAGVENIKLHRFRDTFATISVAQASNMAEFRVVAKHLGHSNLDTIHLYAEQLKNTSPEAKAKAKNVYNYGRQLVKAAGR